MKANRKLLMIAIVISFSFSCKEKSGSNFEVNGTIANIEKLASQYPTLFRKDSLKVYLYEVPFGNELPPVQLDSTYVTSKNNLFTLSANVDHVAMIDVMLENGPMIPLVNDAEKLTVTIDLDSRDNFYTVKGSPASKEMRDFIIGYSDKSSAAELAFKRLDSVKLHSSADSVLLQATNQKNNSVEAINTFSKQALASSTNPVVAAFILGTSSATLPLNELEAELNKRLQKHPSDQSLTFLKKQFDARKAQLAQRDANASQQQATLWVGKKAPQLTLPDANGKNISLDTFKGKFVPVDFWASWCKPCREENPNVVKAFNQLKTKNFTILGVSLDREKESWLKAIQDDQLTWTHVSDLAFWDSKAVQAYRFEGIPYNVLFDPSGTIIAENLRGDALPGKLQEVLQ